VQTKKVAFILQKRRRSKKRGRLSGRNPQEKKKFKVAWLGVAGEGERNALGLVKKEGTGGVSEAEK